MWPYFVFIGLIIAGIALNVYLWFCVWNHDDEQ